MTIQKILVPDMGDFKDVEVIEVLVKKGQDIKKNDSLITLESDKGLNLTIGFETWNMTKKTIYS